MKKNILISVCIVALAGCVQQAVRYQSPAITGQVTGVTEDIISLPVYLSLDSKDETCVKHVFKTSTDEKGNFFIPASKANDDSIPFMQYHLDEWNVCIEINHVRFKVYSDNRYDMGSIDHHVNLECDRKGAAIECRKTR